LTPEYILREWTDEEFDLMVSKYVKRCTAKAESADDEVSVSDSEMFRKLGVKPEKG